MSRFGSSLAESGALGTNSVASSGLRIHLLRFGAMMASALLLAVVAVVVAEEIGVVALALPVQGEIVTRTMIKTIRERTVMIGERRGTTMEMIGGGGAAGARRGAGGAGAGAA